MFDKVNSEIVNAIIIIAIILVAIEIVLFDGGLVVSLGISAILIYLGYQRYERQSGKIFFWIGVVTAIISILNMMVVKFILIAIIGYFIYYYYESRKQPKTVRPSFSTNEADDENLADSDKFQKDSTLLRQSLISHQKTPDEPYPWRDIHITGVFGDRTVDLTETFLPEDDAIISIRHGLGKIQVLVPYEIEVSVHHSTLLGEVTIFNEKLGRVVNETIAYQTEDFDLGQPRVKIMTSLIFGRLEVVRT
ncbi:cell wall-active antibiotics response protein LiaF [Halalkalibacillus sediminis]|uniref:cell wall-active antibiotics response protein LiaF n=1 Tax=Halalkalibacillus sediminis TaxID=2018042 RepID=UPI0013906BF4|nr:cell wall-active antibiotics response protein LiaF [Halalkalibacillus sediminis]